MCPSHEFFTIGITITYIHSTNVPITYITNRIHLSNKDGGTMMTLETYLYSFLADRLPYYINGEGGEGAGYAHHLGPSAVPK